MDVKEFRADFVEAVNGVLEKHFKGLEGKPNKYVRTQAHRFLAN